MKPQNENTTVPMAEYCGSKPTESKICVEWKKGLTNKGKVGVFINIVYSFQTFFPNGFSDQTLYTEISRSYR